MHEFRCYDNVARTRNVSEYLYSLYAWLCYFFLQEDCARTLLFRGADRSVTNQSGQTASQLAIITGSIQLADVIASFSEHDVGKYCTCLLLISAKIYCDVCYISRES